MKLRKQIKDSEQSDESIDINCIMIYVFFFYPIMLEAEETSL